MVLWHYSQRKILALSTDDCHIPCSLFPYPQTDELLVSGDGFMLNMLTLLQEFCVKVSLDKVDPQYPHHPKARIAAKDDTRLKFNAQELESYIETIGKKTAMGDTVCLVKFE